MCDYRKAYPSASTCLRWIAQWCGVYKPTSTDPDRAGMKHTEVARNPTDSEVRSIIGKIDPDKRRAAPEHMTNPEKSPLMANMIRNLKEGRGPLENAAG